MRKFIFIILIILRSQNVSAQNENLIENAIKSDGILPAEVGKLSFNKSGTVDHRGDLNVSIPLMTVPGRGGLDFPLTLTYHAGIRPTDKASWVGLGWNLETGSISRTVNFFPDFQNAANEYINDSSDIPEQSDIYQVSIPGVLSSFMIPTQPIGIMSPTMFYLQDWKEWRISATCDSFTSKRSYVFNSSTKCDKFGSISTQRFQRLDLENLVFCSIDGMPLYPYYISSNMVRNTYKDFSRFELTAENGVKYVFDLPLRSDMEYVNLVTEYVSNWRLTKILSPDYIDDDGTPGPSDGDSGNWIKFEYGYPIGSSNPLVRDIRPYALSDYAMYNQKRHALLTQVTYLTKIITPTHEARFNLISKPDVSYRCPYPNIDDADKQYGTTYDYTGCSGPNGGSRIDPLRIESIDLYSRCPLNSDPTLLSKVVFEYESQGNELCRFTYNGNVGVAGEIMNLGKTTLKKVYFQDNQNNRLPGYEFKYTKDAGFGEFNPPYYEGHISGELPPLQAVFNTPVRYFWDDDYPVNAYQTNGIYRSRTGRMGYLYAVSSETEGKGHSIRNTNGAAAWSLMQIKYPTGATDTYEYESDHFDFETDYEHSSLNGPNSIITDTWENFAQDECGIRIKKITTTDPLTGQSYVTQYEYGTGVLPGLPVSYLRTYHSQIGTRARIKTLYDWSTNDITYKHIKRIEPDGSYRIDYYYTSYNIQYIVHYRLQNCDMRHSHLLSTDFSDMTGKIKQTLYFHSNNVIARKDTFEYFNETHKMFSRTWDPPTGNPVTGWTYSNWTALSKQITKTFDANGKNPISFRKLFGYYNGMIINTQEYHSDSTEIQTQYQYFCEDTSFIDPLSLYFNAIHYLTPVKSISIYTRKATIKNVWEASGHVFTEEEPGLIEWPHYLRQYTEYEYQKAGSFKRLYLSKKKIWSDDNENHLIDTNEMFTVFDSTLYDRYGNLTSVRDAHHNTISFEWGSGYNFSKLTKRTKNGFSRSFTYNPLLLIQQITDENGKTASFEYDGFGRLTRARGPFQELLKEADYHYFLQP